MLNVNYFLNLSSCLYSSMYILEIVAFVMAKNQPVACLNFTSNVSLPFTKLGYGQPLCAKYFHLLPSLCTGVYSNSSKCIEIAVTFSTYYQTFTYLLLHFKFHRNVKQRIPILHFPYDLAFQSILLICVHYFLSSFFHCD